MKELKARREYESNVDNNFDLAPRVPEQIFSNYSVLSSHGVGMEVCYNNFDLTFYCLHCLRILVRAVSKPAR